MWSWVALAACPPVSALPRQSTGRQAARATQQQVEISASVLLEDGCVDLILSDLGSDAPARKPADAGASADMTAALLEGAGQVALLEIRDQLVELVGEGARDINGKRGPARSWHRQV